MSTWASRSGTQYPRTVSTTASSNGNPPWMIGARSGHGTLSRCTCGSAASTARSYAPAGNCGRRGEQPDPPRVTGDDRDLRGRPQHADHVDVATARPHVPLDGIERGRARRVARDHQQLGAGGEQMLGDLDRERLELGLGTVAVREPRRVAEVQVVLGGQRDEQFVQDGEPADAGVEHPDRLVGFRSHRAAWCQSRPPVRSPRHASADRHQHVPDRGSARARKLRPRPGRRAAPDRGGRHRSVFVRARRRERVCPRRIRAAEPAPPPRPVRRRPRPLRPDRVAGVRGERRGASCDAPRHRPHPPSCTPGHARGTPVPRPRRHGLGRARNRDPALGDARAARGAPGRRRRRPLPPDPAGGGARRARARPERPLCAVPSRPEPAREALRPRARGRRRTSDCSRSDRSTRHRFRSTSTRRTRWSSHPNARGSGWPCSRRSPATSRSWPPPSGSTRRRSTESKEPTARRSTKPHGATHSPRTSRTRIRASTDVTRAGDFSTDRMAAAVVTAWRAALER